MHTLRINQRFRFFFFQKETCSISLSQTLLPNADNLVELNCTYTGVLNDQLRGFYRAKYNLNGEEKFGGLTQVT